MKIRTNIQEPVEILHTPLVGSAFARSKEPIVSRNHGVEVATKEEQTGVSAHLARMQCHCFGMPYACSLVILAQCSTFPLNREAALERELQAGVRRTHDVILCFLFRPSDKFCRNLYLHRHVLAIPRETARTKLRISARMQPLARARSNITRRS